MYSSLENSLNSSLDAGDGKRRSSNRSIKRKRFDDEIVEYSVGQQTRIRTQSQSFPGSSFDLPSPLTPQPQTPISAPPTLALVPPVPTPPVLHQQILPEKRNKTMKNLKKKKNLKHGSTIKDLGRWKPVDDLALIIGIQVQTNDIKTVHRGVKFSCKFTPQELSSRWYSLLYDEPINRIAVAAMRNLHPEMIAAVQSKALFSKGEEEILATIKSSESPTEETFQDLLTKNATVFYHARTPKSLMIHWELMRQYSLLADQNIPSLTSPDGLPTFSDYEELMNDNELMAEHRDEHLDIEMALIDRKNKREIRTIENELSRWSILLDNCTGIGISPEFDNQTLAILRGRAVRYLMRSREITFGRNSKDLVVDVNLALEGAAHKVSRKQGTIKLRSNGDFFIVNEGKRPIFIDGAPVITGGRSKLSNNNVIEISGLRFIFLVNFDLIQAIRSESAKLVTPLN
ncbi:CLUMA_CG019549, isoform A [Clunio marinus]|uniref:CLUMA_CG019549, isoform A n=1 Tax=Clunio marinus TaxID=568069 RepID=A0A1J1J2Q2_9DIPT|nr:CLUMA_CG019549, isoform A [Clunio marinus]